MGKVDERRKKLFDYIKEKEHVSTKELLEHFKIRKATLSEDIAALKEQGIPLVTTRGFVGMEKETDSNGYYETITASTIRCWLILLILSKAEAPMKFRAIQQAYSEINELYSVDTLHKDLQSLQEMGYLSFNTYTYCYHLTNRYYSYITPSLEALDDFCYIYSQHKEANPTDLELERLHEIAVILDSGFEDSNSFQTNDTYLIHGKRNQLSKETRNQLHTLLCMDYSDYQLNICYLTNTNKQRSALFSIGLIVYSVEKNRMYLLGETPAYKTIIPVDSIVSISMTTERNHIYKSEEYQSIFQEMFSISVDEPEVVKIAFANEKFIYDKVRTLHSRRPASTMTLSQDQTQILYTDIIRGIPDFSNYLRQFGRGAVVLEPENLRQQMIYSAQKIIEAYREEFHYE